MPAIGEVFATDVPARLDRLPWSRFHWLVVAALGVTWILDGLEVTIVGSLGSVLQEPTTLALTARDVGYSATAYIAGAISGATAPGWNFANCGALLMLTVRNQAIFWPMRMPSSSVSPT